MAPYNSGKDGSVFKFTVEPWGTSSAPRPKQSWNRASRESKCLFLQMMRARRERFVAFTQAPQGFSQRCYNHVGTHMENFSYFDHMRLPPVNRPKCSQKHGMGKF